MRLQPGGATLWLQVEHVFGKLKHHRRTHTWVSQKLKTLGGNISLTLNNIEQTFFNSKGSGCLHEFVWLDTSIGMSCLLVPDGNTHLLNKYWTKSTRLHANKCSRIHCGFWLAIILLGPEFCIACSWTHIDTSTSEVFSHQESPGVQRSFSHWMKQSEEGQCCEMRKQSNHGTTECHHNHRRFSF